MGLVSGMGVPAGQPTAGAKPDVAGRLAQVRLAQRGPIPRATCAEPTLQLQKQHCFGRQSACTPQRPLACHQPCSPTPSSPPGAPCCVLPRPCRRPRGPRAATPCPPPTSPEPRPARCAPPSPPTAGRLLTRAWHLLSSKLHPADLRMPTLAGLFAPLQAPAAGAHAAGAPGLAAPLGAVPSPQAQQAAGVPKTPSEQGLHEAYPRDVRHGGEWPVQCRCWDGAPPCAAFLRACCAAAAAALSATPPGFASGKRLLQAPPLPCFRPLQRSSSPRRTATPPRSSSRRGAACLPPAACAAGTLPLPAAGTLPLPAALCTAGCLSLAGPAAPWPALGPWKAAALHQQLACPAWLPPCRRRRAMLRARSRAAPPRPARR